MASTTPREAGTFPPASRATRWRPSLSHILIGLAAILAFSLNLLALQDKSSTTLVVVADGPISAGAVFTQEDVRLVPVPTEFAGLDSLLLLLFGGVALDFWRGLALQRELAGVADSAAIAAASGIDEEIYRADGEVILNVGRARGLALSSIAFQDVDLTSTEIVIGADGSSVSVTIEGVVELGLLGVFVDETEPLTVRASATAGPRVVP